MVEANDLGPPMLDGHPIEVVNRSPRQRLLELGLLRLVHPARLDLQVQPVRHLGGLEPAGQLSGALVSCPAVDVAGGLRRHHAVADIPGHGLRGPGPGIAMATTAG